MKRKVKDQWRRSYRFSNARTLDYEDHWRVIRRHNEDGYTRIAAGLHEVRVFEWMRITGGIYPAATMKMATPE